MGVKNKLKQIPGSWYFLLIVIISYVFLFIFNNELYSSCLEFFSKIILQILPIFILIFVLMALTNLFFDSKFISKHIEKERGIGKWIFVIVGGILSAGPIYMWYPLLANLKEKGLSYGLIATFLYNRAAKLPLLPLMIFYFGLRYVVVLSLVMIFMSVVQGIIINKFMEVKK